MCQVGVPARGGVVGEGALAGLGGDRDEVAVLVVLVPPLAPLPEGMTCIVVQGDSGGLRLGWVDLDLGCSTILLGQ